ncbi:hypothetical protein P3T76_000409 [Phytophthora citrophthora]|uniref:Uncharacterized protein n=1 Tax=Phytophthora citrophthora TaxID=4793 RepID=A0AAD9GZU0_9STRA|nr:hypothetical protein P3T76_000409 [Phytophthora citrophthora]
MAAGRGTGAVNRDGDIPSVSGMLRASLAESARLLAELEREQRGLTVYKRCCRQLVSYMAVHMDTSRGFVQHMEKVIDASYSNLEEATLRSELENELWVKYIGNSDAETTPGTPSPRGTIKVDADEDGTVTMTPLAVAKASIATLIPTCSPHVDLTLSTPPTVGRGGKRMKQRGQQKPQDSKRARHAVARTLYGTGTLNYEEKEENSETETETEMEGNEEKGSLQVDKGGGMLWPCTGGNPSQQTAAYKQRLKAAVKIIDATNCCPPPGMVCTQGCAGIRARMCEAHRTQGGNGMPCHNGMCCVWREVDSHFVRCQNSQCEFKNVVGLRQAKHDIQQHERRLEAITLELRGARTAMRGSFECDSGLDAIVKALERKLSQQEDAVLLHKDRERAFTVDLNVLRTRVINGGSNEFPHPESHYTKNPEQ